MRRFCIETLSVLAGISGMPVFAAGQAVLTAEFSGSGLPVGWTAEGDAYRSPEYSNAVDRIELRYSGADASASATVSAFPKQGNGTTVATLTAASSGAAFDFPDTTDFRSFRIAATSGFALSSFAAYVSTGALDAPSGVAVSNNITGTSFDAAWNAVEGATGYRVYVWTNVVAGASAGTEVWAETFANAPEKKTSTDFNVSYTDNGTGDWTFSKVYAHSEAGRVRIGNTSTKGILVSPAIGNAVASSGSLSLRINACKQEGKDGDFMPVGIVSENATNIVDVIELATTLTEYHIALPVLSSTDRIALMSPTNKTSARAIVDDVAILSGYSEGQPEPSYIVNEDVGAATSYSFTGLPSVPVQFAVEAYGRRDVSSAKTEAVEVDLANPDKVAVLNACPLSSLASSARTYTQDFDSLASLTETTGDKEWLNGTTLRYWQAYKDDVPVASFKYNGGSGTTGGCYALADAAGSTLRALGAYSTKSDEFSFGVSFTNDTGRTMTLSVLKYDAQQWGFKNSANQTMSVSVKVADVLDWLAAYGDGWTELGNSQSKVYTEGEPHDTPDTKPVEIHPAETVSVAPGQVLALKWTVHSLTSGTSGMMGIDNVEVTFAAQPTANALVIRLAENP